jgi:hypothetical protein
VLLAGSLEIDHRHRAIKGIAEFIGTQLRRLPILFIILNGGIEAFPPLLADIAYCC